MHVLELPQALIDKLYQVNVPDLNVRVEMTGRMQTLVNTGSSTTTYPSLPATLQFPLGANTTTTSSNFDIATIDITDRLIEGQAIRISTEKPIAPDGTGKQTRGALVKLTIINTDGKFSMSGGLIDPVSIQNLYFRIFAKINGQDLEIYRGRCIGRPKEKLGQVTFTITDAVKDLVDVPLVCPIVGQNQYYRLLPGNTPDIQFEIQNNVYWFGALVYFGERGLPRPWVTNSKTEAIGLLHIDFIGTKTTPFRLPISKFEIEFIDSINYRITFPDQGPQFGRIDQAHTNEYFEILPEYWEVLGDPTDARIEFYASFACVGNPITIIKCLIEYALRNNWGEQCTFNSSLPVDWFQLNKLEAQYRDVWVYVNESNLEPSVYSYTDSQKPISVKQIIEWIADHVGCFLTTDLQGRITLTADFYRESELQVINSDMIESHLIESNTDYDQVQITYGYNALSKNIGGREIFTEVYITDYDESLTWLPGQKTKFNFVIYECLRQTTGTFDATAWTIYKTSEYRLMLRYYKTGSSEGAINRFAPKIANRLFAANEVYTIKPLPNHALALTAGDKVSLSITEIPAISSSVEIKSLNKVLGGEAVAKCVSLNTADIEGNSGSPAYCAANFCEGTYC